jgi:hypothetical protein
LGFTIALGAQFKLAYQSAPVPESNPKSEIVNRKSSFPCGTVFYPPEQGGNKMKKASVKMLLFLRLQELPAAGKI